MPYARREPLTMHFHFRLRVAKVKCSTFNCILQSHPFPFPPLPCFHKSLPLRPFDQVPVENSDHVRRRVNQNDGTEFALPIGRKFECCESDAEMGQGQKNGAEQSVVFPHRQHGVTRENRVHQVPAGKSDVTLQG